MIVARLRAFFPKADMPPETVSAYADILCELDFNDCAAGCRQLVLSTNWMPSVAEIAQETKRARKLRVAAERKVIAEREWAEWERVAIGPPPEHAQTIGYELPPVDPNWTGQEGHHDHSHAA